MLGDLGYSAEARDTALLAAAKLEKVRYLRGPGRKYLPRSAQVACGGGVGGGGGGGGGDD